VPPENDPGNALTVGRFDMREEPHRLAHPSMTLSEPIPSAALTDGEFGHGITAASDVEAASGQSVPHFLRTLFRLLEESDVRYCVLHSWKLLPERLPSDLDLAVHPSDKLKLPTIFEDLRQAGYVPIQWGNYLTNAHSFYFKWETDSSVKTAAVDIIFEHRRGGLILATGEELVQGRVRHGQFWIPSPEIEFAYLLAKKTWKGAASLSQSLRLADLVRQLGHVEAERIAAQIFQGRWKKRVIEICARGTIDKDLGHLRPEFWRMGLSRHPLRMIRHVLGECQRGVRRSIHPTGILISVLGPDGVGKSTLIESLPKALGASFRRRRVFHWRPQAFARRRNNRPVTNPHGQVPRGRLISMAYLSAFFIDYWIGYLLVIRPLLVRSGIVQFDRYFHDVLVDPKRYRYGGPRWFAEILSRLVREPDLVILLDADEHLIHARKAELPVPEIKRLRQAYRKLRFKRAREVYVRTEAGIEPTLLASATAVTDFMKERFNERIGHWMSVA
jgi:thymidylate kinase